MNLQTDVFTLADGCLDLILTGIEPPIFREGIIQASGFEVIPGGAVTTAIALARLGVKVSWAHDFGSDPISNYIRNTALKEGVDLSFSKIHIRNLRRISVSLSEQNNRRFISFQDQNPIIPVAFNGLLQTKAGILYMPGTYFKPIFHLATMLSRGKKMKLVVDGNGAQYYSIKERSVQRALRSIDLYILNSYEALHLSGERNLIDAVKALSQFCRRIVIKDGPRGAAYLNNNGNLVHLPAIHVNAIDTTGAGDCFNAGFLSGWLNKESIEVCVMRGNIVAGLSTTKRGGLTVHTDSDIVRHYLANYDALSCKP